jgi:hypothetical protein
MEKLSNGTVKRIRIQKIKEWTRFGFDSEIRWRWADITVTVRRVHIRVLLTAPPLTPNLDYIIITSGGETKQATNALAAWQRVISQFSFPFLSKFSSDLRAQFVPVVTLLFLVLPCPAAFLLGCHSES